MMTADLDALLRTEPVRAAIADLDDAAAVRRLHERDASLWSDDDDVQATIADRLGWLDVAGGMPDAADAITRLRDTVAADGLVHVVLAGMGGSSLAPEVFARVFEGQVRGASLQVLDSTHPHVVQRLLDDADLSSSLVIVSSKSGGTEETRSFGLRAQALAPDSAHLLAITDADSALDDEAVRRGWRDVLRNPSDIGGRFSALSLFGMVPAALAGVDVDEIWARGGRMLAACGPDVPAAENPGAQLAAFMGGLARTGRDKLTILADPAVASFGDWAEQLVAESTGKQGRGIVPVVGEPVLAPDVYSEDRAFVALRMAGLPVPGVAEIAAAGHPVLVLDLDDPYDLGAEFVRWEVATALAGVLLGVNPFDEPNVSESKRNTVAVLEEVEQGGELPPPEDGDVDELIGTLRPGDHLSLQAYLDPHAVDVAQLQRVRAAVSERLGVVTTLGYGPRFLHSTGQLHKGGPEAIAVIQLVDASLWSDPPAVEIPSRPYSFSTLHRAQAVGDLRSLRDHQRRVVQVGVGPEGLGPVVEQIEAALG